MKLYSVSLSGHAHRVRLFLALIGQSAELIEVDIPNRAHKQPDFLKLNSFGQVPVLVDGGQAVADSNAILVYLSKKFGKTDWLPEDAAQAAAVQRWLSVAAGELAFGPAAARLVTVFGAPLNAEVAINLAHVLLKRMDDTLAGQSWIAGGQRPTIADVALYSYTAHAPEGNVDLEAYANVRQWLARVEALPGFVAMPRTPVGLAA